MKMVPFQILFFLMKVFGYNLFKKFNHEKKWGMM